MSSQSIEPNFTQAVQVTSSHSLMLLGKVSDHPSLAPLPLFLEKIRAGFPSPAQDFVENELDLNELMIKHPSATYLLKVAGTSMIGLGIAPNDILVVDRSLNAMHEDVVIAMLDGEFTCKQLLLEPTAMLKAHSNEHKDILLENYGDVQVFGVVTNVIKQFKR